MMMSVGFMGAALRWQDPRTAWEVFSRMLREDPSQRMTARRLAETEGGRELLDASRKAWRRRGLEAPFESFLREAEGRAEELR
jgi:hypothetical protein